MVDEMHFGFLYNAKKKMLSIGYDAGEGRLSKCHYDLLPSEARAAVFGAIAKSDIPQESWFELRRLYAKFEHEPVLRSWTGTAFEYLMPNLWFKIYPDTVLDYGARAAIRAQSRNSLARTTFPVVPECSCNETTFLTATIATTRLAAWVGWRSITMALQMSWSFRHIPHFWECSSTRLVRSRMFGE